MSYPARAEGLVNSTLSHIISLNPPTRSLSITGHWNVSLPSGVSPRNSIFGPGRRSKYNTLQLLIYLYLEIYIALNSLIFVPWTKLKVTIKMILSVHASLQGQSVHIGMTKISSSDHCHSGTIVQWQPSIWCEREEVATDSIQILIVSFLKSRSQLRENKRYHSIIPGNMINEEVLRRIRLQKTDTKKQKDNVQILEVHMNKNTAKLSSHKLNWK